MAESGNPTLSRKTSEALYLHTIWKTASSQFGIGGRVSREQQATRVKGSINANFYQLLKGSARVLPCDLNLQLDEAVAVNADRMRKALHITITRENRKGGGLKKVGPCGGILSS